ncbi:MAG: hypothetical protein V1691_03525 [Chloroflexota bacterium]
MARGKLYKNSDKQSAMEIDYQLQNESPANWWGELVLMEYSRISEGGGYTIELEDQRQGRCSIRKRVNRAVSGVPPRYIYHFTGLGPLQKGA